MNASTKRRAIIGAIAVLVLAAFAFTIASRGSGDEEAAVETNVPVYVGSVGRGTLHRYVTAYGYVEPEPPGDGRPAAGVMLSPLVDGVVSEIDCVEGRRVTAGQVLFKLDSRLAQVAVERARQQLDFAEKAFARQQDLMSANGTSERAYLEAQQQLDAARSDLSAAETQLAYLEIATPLTGTVVRVNATVGQHVDATTVLAQVVDLRRLVVSARVARRDIEGVEIGESVLIGADSLGAQGVVTVVGQDIDPRTGTYFVRSSIPSGMGFLPGQFIDIRIAAEEHRDVLVVPEVSVVTRADEGSWIMVVEGDRAVRRAVVVGLRDEGLVEVSGDGVEEGMTIVTEDAYALPEETQIQILQR